jgi:hypothetical protein
MENLKIEVEETKTYKQRMRRASIVPIVFVACVLMLGPIINMHLHRPIEIPIGIIIYCVIVLVFSGILYDTICSTFITLIEINENTVHIIFTERNKKHEITDTIDKFSFRLKNTLSQRAHFKITHENYSISQYCFWNWKKENAFFDLWDYLKKRGLLKTGWFS